MRRMSFMLTEPQLLDGTKDVTRRDGWENAVPGEQLMAIDKSDRVRSTEAVRELAVIEVVSVRRERLGLITDKEVVREGFPQWRRGDFLRFMLRTLRLHPQRMITRIEFRIVRKLV